ncbi:UDP-glucuronosyltransferase 1-6, partial [Vespula squamosa]
KIRKIPSISRELFFFLLTYVYKIIIMNSGMPYLEAIQAIPGDTPTEKYQWMSKLIKDRIKIEGKELDLNNWKDIGQPLVPLVKIIAGNILKRYDIITEALKSEDLFIVSKALKARWYFDGRNKNIVNVDFFFKNILPYVSLKARKRIIKSLSCHLGRKHPTLAEKFFLALSKAYGVDQSIVLLRACNESFIYDIVVRHRIVVSNNVLKKWYLTKPNLVIRYLKLDQPNDDPLVRKTHKVSVHQYTNFLPTLIKKNLDDFIEIFERYETNPPAVNLKFKCANMFLKNARETFLEKPKLFINIIPLKLIDANRMDIIFPKLLPKDINKFNTNQMLTYLQHYPVQKQASLFLKSYEDVYKKSLFENISNVTSNLLSILPVNQRVNEARRLISQNSSDYTYDTNYKSVWRCYLPTKEIMSTIISEANKGKFSADRVASIIQIIYSCKVNQDDDALFETLEHINVRHKNEDGWFWASLFEGFRKIYDLSDLSKRHWDVIDEIIERNYIKEQLSTYYPSRNRLLVESAIRFRLKNHLSLTRILNIFVEIELQNWNNRWLFQDNAEYQKICLNNILEIIKNKFDAKDPQWEKTSKLSVVHDLLFTIKVYNRRHAKKGTNPQLRRLYLKHYPWLMEQTRLIVTKEPPIESYLVDAIKKHLKKEEKDLYKMWVVEEENVADVDSGKALAQLKKNPEFVLKEFGNYLNNCEASRHVKTMKRFVTTSRWYKDIPIKFAEEALRRLKDENKSYYIQFLGMLLYGETYAKIVDPYIPKEKTMDIQPNETNNKYKLLMDALKGILMSDPPVPIEIISRICEGDYLSLALRVITNVCDRTSLTKIKSFAKDLASKRVSVRKHGIRLICRIETLQESSNFLLSQWKEEKHHSIREVIIMKAYNMFKKEPGDITWSTFKNCLRDFKSEDWKSKPFLFPVKNIPTEYVCDFIREIINMSEEAIKTKELDDDSTARWYIENIVSKIDEAIANILPDKFCEEIIEKYLFNPDYVIKDTFRKFTVNNYLLLRKDKVESRFVKLTDIFLNFVKTGWDVAHPNKSHFYPVNYTIRAMIHDVMSHLLSDNKYDLRIIDGALKLFNNCMTPDMDLTSYLLLVLTKEYVESNEPTVFAKKLCGKIPELVCEFSPLYPSSIIDSLQHFFAIIRIENLEEVKLTVIEELMKCPSIYAHLVAASSLPVIKISANVARYDALVNVLRKSDNPTVRSILYTKINAAGFYSCTVDP